MLPEAEDRGLSDKWIQNLGYIGGINSRSLLYLILNIFKNNVVCT